jgi:hypothetical protein
MKTSPALTPILLAFCCSLLAAQLPTRAEEVPAPAPAVFEGMQAAEKLFAEKKWDEAEAKLRDLLREPGMEPTHPAVANVRLKLASVCSQRNKHADAFAEAALAAPVLEQAMGKENLYAIFARWLGAREAMAANNPAAAAELAAPLLETLRTYVTSGHAKTAAWENVPGLQPHLAELPGLNEVGIATVASLLGRAWAAADEPEKALPVLKEAAGMLEKLLGPGHPELVAVQQVLEALAVKRGETVGRRYVGDLGSSRKLVFEGNVTFSAEQLRKALAIDVGFVMASHPAAEFADFPAVIQRGLESGYFAAGFPKARVEVTRDVTRDAECLKVRITEGPRYRMGEIRIEGLQEVAPDKLLQKLLVVAKDEDEGSLAGLLRKTMLEHKNLLPQPEVQAAEAAVEELNDQLPSFRQGFELGNVPKEAIPAPEQAPKMLDFFQKMASSQEKATWLPGDPVRFIKDDTNPLREVVRQYLAELGRPLAQLGTSHDFRDDGTVDLVIRIAEEGPAAVLGNVNVIGCTRHTAAEIATAAGLSAGQAVTPMLLDSATVALWNTGRFFPFLISLQARDPQEWEVDITIQAREINGVPPLAEALAPEVETGRRFIATLNEWMVTGKFTDFQVTSKGNDRERGVFGLSSRDGLFFQYSKDEPHQGLALGISQDGVLFDLTSGEHRGCGRLPGLSDKSRAWFHLLPNNAETGQRFQVGLGFGFSSLEGRDGRLPIEVVISPSIPMLKPEAFRREGDQVVFSENGAEMLRLDMASALPVAGRQTGFEFRDGVVRERRAALAAELAASDGGDATMAWLEAIVAVLRFVAVVDGEDNKPLEEFCAKWVQLGNTLLKPEVLKPFKDLYLKWSEPAEGAEAFFVPLDPALLQDGGGTMTLLVSFGAVALSEMLASPDAWVSKLSRELVFIYGGKTQYTARTIDELLADPTMGPYGCQITAQVLAKLSEGAARRFLAKALEQANAEGFSRDWRLLLESPLGLGKAMEEFLAALAALSTEDEQAAAAVLTPAQAQWLSAFLTRLRERSAGESVADWIAPNMDQLWVSFLQDPLRQKLESLLKPACDPAKVAAVVNGQPVPRILVRTIADRFFQHDPMQAPQADATRPWTQDPALALAIRLALLEQEAARQGGSVNESKVKALVEQSFAELKDQPDEKWLAAIGMTHEEVVQIFAKSIFIRNTVTSLMAAVPTPDEAASEAYYQQHARELSRQPHFHLIAVAHPNGYSLTQATRATRLASQTAAALREGLPFAAMKAAAAANERAGLKLSCGGLTGYLLDLPPAGVAALEALLADEDTAPLLWGADTRIFHIEGWQVPEPRPFAEVKTQVAQLLHRQQMLQKINARCQPFEASADVLVLEDPLPNKTAASVFDELLKTDSFGAVGRLGAFWDKALAQDKTAEAALENVLDCGVLDSATLVLLADALLARDQRPLAARCVREAADLNSVATRKAVAEALARHRESGTKGQQDQLEQLMKLP